MGAGDCACQAAIMDYGCSHEISNLCSESPSFCAYSRRGHVGPDRLSDDVPRGPELVFLRSAGAVAAEPIRRKTAAQHRRAALVCRGGRQSAPGDAGFGGQVHIADAAREFHHLFQGGQPPPRQQPRGRLPHDLLDGIRSGLRVPLGLREAGARHARMRAYAPQGRAQGVRVGAVGRAGQHRVEPAVGRYGRQVAAAPRRLAPSRSADVLPLEPASLRRRETRQNVALLTRANLRAGRG